MSTNRAISVSAAAYTRFRAAAVERGITITQLVEQALPAHLHAPGRRFIRRQMEGTRKQRPLVVVPEFARRRIKVLAAKRGVRMGDVLDKVLRAMLDEAGAPP